jgi:phytoene dehydrogenase-like protein
MYVGVMAGVKHELFERKFGENPYFQFMLDWDKYPDWHGVVTVPTYVDPDLAPPGHDYIIFNSHVQISREETDKATAYQERIVETLKEIWPDFQEKADWYHPVIYPNVFTVPPKTGITGNNRVGFSVPDIDGLYLAGESAYSSGSGIGSAVKAGWGAVREIMRDDGHEFDTPLDTYLSISDE